MSGQFLFVHTNEWADFETPDAIPLSQGYILAHLKENGFGGEILGEYKNRPLTPHRFKSFIQTTNPHAVGFSAYEENMHRIRAWARFAKSIKPDIDVILGGPQTTFMPAEALQEMREVDVLCRGEGEAVMLNLAKAITSGTSKAQVDGICFLENGIPVETGSQRGTENLDDIPSPYISGVLSPNGKSRMILLSSRGCTSPCTFCYTTKASGKKIRFHSSERIIEEMLFLKKHGKTDFWFADPNFAYSKSRLESLLEEIIRKVSGIGFWCQTRYNLIDRKLISLLKRAGAHTVAFGLESADPHVLKRIKKGLDLEKMSKAIKLVQDAGIKVELFTLFGLPGESAAQAEKTLDFVKQNNVDITDNSISQQLHLFFGTPINDNPSDHGITPLPTTKPSYQSISRDFQTNAMQEEEIRSMGLIWRLNRQDFAENVRHGINLFNIAGYITQNKQYFRQRPEAYRLLAEIYMQLDEYESAASCLLSLQAKFNDTQDLRSFLAKPIVGYKSKRRGIAKIGSKVIFDCRGLDKGKTIPETVCHFRIACLGDGSLLPDFETGLIGMKSGSASQLKVTFPATYGNRKLAGEEITFQVFLHQVLEPVFFQNFEHLQEAPPRNMYRFEDLIGLQKYNENLYYMVLRDSILHSLSGNLNNMLALFNYYLKLGFIEKALDLAHSLPKESSIMGHVGRVFLANARAEDALDFLDQAANTDIEIETQRIKAHINLGQYDEAEGIASDPKFSTSLKVLNQRTQLASLQGLPVEIYLERMDQLLDCQVKMMHANMQR